MRIYPTIIIILIFNLVNGQNYLPFISKDYHKILLDGSLNESYWEDARVITKFKQLNPQLGRDATEKTMAYLIYDEDFLYVGIKCSFNNSETIYSRILERDAVQDGDDYVEIHIDSYNDKSNSLVFRTNPLAARYDYEVNRNGGKMNSSWDTFWDSKTRRTNSGWSAEIKIPFSSLRYNQLVENAMRIKIVVNYKFINQTVISKLIDINVNQPQFHYANSDVFLFRNLPKNKTLFVTPYIKGSVLIHNMLNEPKTKYINETEWLVNNDFVKNKSLDKVISNIGLDIKYKFNSSHTLDLTLNTDFAQAEADEQIINLTRFSVLLPEKREFFLENADFFNSSKYTHRLFNSRQIGISDGKVIPIIGGLRYLGSSKRFQFGIISMQAHEIKRIKLPSTNMTNIRGKLNLKNGSYIGFIGTSKISGGDISDYNYLGGIDGSLRTKNNLRFDFTLAMTFDKQVGNWHPMYHFKINTIGKQGWAFETTYRDYSKSFSPELGFLTRPNTKSFVFYHEWKKNYSSRHNSLQELIIGNYYQKEWVSSNGKPGYSQADIYSSYKFKNGLTISAGIPVYIGDYIYTPWNITKDIFIPVGKYNTLSAYFILKSGNSNKYRFSFNSFVGQFYGGFRLGLEPVLDLDISKSLSSEIGVNYNRLHFPKAFSINNSDKATILNRMFSRFKYSFSSKLFINTYVQYDNNINILGGNIRFRYTPMEGTDLYVVYNINMNTERVLVSPDLPSINNQNFIIKFSKTFIK